MSATDSPTPDGGPDARASARVVFGLTLSSLIAVTLAAAWLAWSGDEWTRAVRFRWLHLAAGCGLLTIAATAFYTRLIGWLALTLRDALFEIKRLVFSLNHWLEDEPAHVIALVMIALVGLAIRLNLLDRPMRLDECSTIVEYATQPLWELFTRYAEPNNHVLHSLFVWASIRLFGLDPWAVRLPAFVCGMAIIPLAYLAGRSLFSRNTALLAASLVAASSMLIEYSTEARSYSFQAAIVLLCIAIAPRLVKRGDRPAWAAFAILLSLAAFALPTTAHVASTFTLWLFIAAFTDLASARDAPAAQSRAALCGRTILALVAVAFAAAVFYGPIHAMNGYRAIVANKYTSPLTWHDFWPLARTVPGELAAQWTRDWPWPLSAALAAGVVLSVFALPRRAKLRSPFVLSMLVAVVGMVVLARVTPIYFRIYLWMLAPLIIHACAGLMLPLEIVTRRRRVAADGTLCVIAVIMSAWLAGITWSTQSVRSSPYGDGINIPETPLVARWLVGELRPGDRLIGSWQMEPQVRYHLLRFAGPASENHWLLRVPEAKRAVILVHDRYEPLDKIIRDQRIDTDATPRLLTRIEHVGVYVIDDPVRERGETQ